jgi:hypothetical protein
MNRIFLPSADQEQDPSFVTLLETFTGLDPFAFITNTSEPPPARSLKKTIFDPSGEKDQNGIWMLLHSVGSEKLFQLVGHDNNLRRWSIACEVTYSGKSEGEDSSYAGDYIRMRRNI